MVSARLPAARYYPSKHVTGARRQSLVYDSVTNELSYLLSETLILKLATVTGTGVKLGVYMRREATELYKRYFSVYFQAYCGLQNVTTGGETPVKFPTKYGSKPR